MTNLIETTYFWVNQATDPEVIKVLTDAYLNSYRIRLFLGDQETGEDWGEDCDIMGYIGRTTGTRKIPILVYSKRCTGGGAIFTDSIVKITFNRKVLYQHPKYHLNTDKLTSDWELLNMDFFLGKTNVKKHLR